MSQNLNIYTPDVDGSGKNQMSIGSNFNEAVENIYNAMNAMCSSEWLGYSSTYFTQHVEGYKAGLQELGSLIIEHGKKDVDSAQIFEDTDSDIARHIM